MRASVVVLFALAACRGAEAPAETLSTSASVPLDAAQADTTRTRAEAAGLTEAQVADLERLGMPIYVPNLPAGWTLAEMTSATPPPGSMRSPEYALHYATPAGACLILEAVPEGFGDVSAADPPNERAVDVPGVPTAGPVRLGWGARAETVGGWAGGRVATEWFGVDDPLLRLTTGDECPRPSADDAEALLASLRPLDVADDAILIGPVSKAERMDDWPPPNPDLERAARVAFGWSSADGGTFETLRRRDRHAVVLVTKRRSGSAHGMRTRGVLVLVRGLWHIESYGSQWQCLPGDTEWVATPCT